ncbi:MAG: 3'-5' exonuclease, partial [Planctomycetaceae bacterium]
AGQPNLSEFANQLLAAVVEESRESLAAIHPESGNVVRLMTIHQSKGLEFPVVFVADMNRRSRSGLEGALLDDRLGPLLPLPPRFSRARPNLGRDVLALLEQPEELFETQRLLYVATTRAADLLILSGTLQEKEGRLKLEHPWMQLLSSRFDLQTGQPSLSPDNPLLVRQGRELPEIRVHHQPPQGTVGAGSSRTPGTGLIPWLERLDQTSPAELPPEIREFLPDPRARQRFSVSSLENLLEVCPPAERPPESDWSDLLDRVEVDWPHHASPDAPFHPGAGLAEGEATLLGTLVHKVLELGGGDPQESLRRVFESLLLPVSPRLRELAEECVATVMSDRRFDPIRSLPGQDREVEFQLRRGTSEFPCWVIGKIDAILREPAGWRVIDFKTGHVAARRDFALTTLNKYALQLGVYSLAIAEWTGQLPGPMELVWLPRGERLRFQPDRPFLDRIARLL